MARGQQALRRQALALYLSEAELNRCTVETFLTQVKRELRQALNEAIEKGTVEEASSARGGVTYRKVKDER